jgi:hypothetical protein
VGFEGLFCTGKSYEVTRLEEGQATAKATVEMSSSRQCRFFASLRMEKKKLENGKEN